MFSSLIASAVFGQAVNLMSSAGTIYQEPVSYAFAPSGTQFVAGMADSTIKIFDAKTRQMIRKFNLPGKPFQCPAVAWSPTGSRIAVGAENASIHIFPVAGGKPITLTGHLRPIQALNFDKTGKKLVSTGQDDVIRVWDLNKNRCVLTILGKGVNVYFAKFDSTGTKIVCATLGKGIQIYNASSGQLIRSLGGHGGLGVNSADINSGFTRAVSAGRDGKITIWNPANGQKIGNCMGHKDWVINVSISPNGKYIASSGADGTVKVWLLSSGAQVGSMDRMSFVGSPLSWSASSGFLLAMDEMNKIKVFVVR